MKKQIKHSRIVLTVIPVAVVLTAGIAFLFSRSDSESQVCQQNVARLKEFENTDISSVEQAISDIQGQLDAQADAQAREDIVNSSGILTNVQIRQAFAGSVIVGDSITQAISEYGYLDTDVVVSKRGLSVVNAQEQFSTAISLNPSHVFLAFGTNDLEIYNGDPTGFIDAIGKKFRWLRMLSQMCQFISTASCLSRILPLPAIRPLATIHSSTRLCRISVMKWTVPLLITPSLWKIPACTNRMVNM